MMTMRADVLPSGEDLLRAASLRITAPRLAVLAAVGDHPHADVETITADVRVRIGSVSTQAVYDVLKALTRARLLRRIEPAGSPALFETRVGDNHHHVICRSCGLVGDVDCVVGSAPCLEASDGRGFVIEEAEITYWGLCSECLPGTAVSGAVLTPDLPPPTTEGTTKEHA